MKTKAERDLEEELGPSPWTMYEDQEEPWKDHDLMVKLDEQFQYQYEIAHVLGCKPSKISYWMGEAKEYKQREALKAGELCVNCEEQETPGGAETGNELCADCMDKAREGGRGHEIEATL